MVEEARLEKGEMGMAPATDGWFVVNVRDTTWVRSDVFGDAAVFEGDGPGFRDIGYTLAVLQPGQPNAMYHREGNQEDFLVLAGECLAIIEGRERRLRAWDFVHCPAGTEHIFVGAGHEACVIFMAGCRTHPKDVVYVKDELAARHHAGVDSETTEPADAYAPYPGWTKGPPATWAGMPWA